MTSYTNTPDITTIGGRNFKLLEPAPEQIEIEDIAHALSMLCRFSGHVREFYSVAEHCVRVSLICDPADALAGLLHDAAEAYVNDLVGPLKRELPEYQAIENRIWQAIAVRFGLPACGEGNRTAEIPESVKRADKIMLATEGRDLCHPGWEYYKLPYKPEAEKIRPWPSIQARNSFLYRFAQLTGWRPAA